jgi:hypothetical protein
VINKRVHSAFTRQTRTPRGENMGDKSDGLRDCRVRSNPPNLAESPADADDYDQ